MRLDLLDGVHGTQHWDGCRLLAVVDVKLDNILDTYYIFNCRSL